jgi:hypothetical protein
VLVATNTSRGETVFLGPLPYLSAADSPFDLFGPDTDFFLEDFEDGELNTPGIVHAFGAPAQVLSPSPTTDSVDADDAEIDGWGNDGFSLASSNGAVAGSRNTHFISFHFQERVLGGLPTAFGFVWTDGGASSSIELRILDTERNELATAEFTDIGDTLQGGETDEDRFFGVISDQPFAYIVLSSDNFGEHVRFEADHVQNGLIIPEPSTIVLTAVAIPCVWAACKWQTYFHNR